MSERLKQVMSDVLEVPSGRIDEATSQETLDDWTSLVHLRLITELEDAFGVRVAMDEVPTLNSYPTIVAFLDGKGALA